MSSFCATTTITMNKEKRSKLKTVNNGNMIINEIDARIVDDEGNVITKAFSSFSICLKPEDDFPHPRHLCFQYPFGKSSPKRHCSKCYCYVCEEIAPCKMWKKHPKRHCDASEKGNKWKLERQLRKNLPGSTTMVNHKLTVSTFFNSSGEPLQGLAGGVISNNEGEWIVGISMHLKSEIDTQDCSVSCYLALLDCLQLAWSKRFRDLDVKLGFAFHLVFWQDFTKDFVTRKFCLCDDPSSNFLLLKIVEEYLNRDWFIDVKNTKSFEEEAGAYVVAILGDVEDQAIKVYDFRKYPFTAYVMNVAKRFSFEKHAHMASTAEERKYFGLN